MAKVSKVKSNKTLNVCVLLILVSLVLDNIAQLTNVFEHITGKAKKYKNLEPKEKTEYVMNIIVTVIYVVVLVLCLVSLFKK
jgi:hypothetical protein